MSDLYRIHDEPEAVKRPDEGFYSEKGWLVSVEPDRDLIAETISDAKGTERVTDKDYKWADHIIKWGWRADDEPKKTYEPVEPVDRVWFCSYKLPLRWEANGDFACNPDNPRTGADCTEKCGWYLMVADDDE